MVTVVGESDSAGGGDQGGEGGIAVLSQLVRKGGNEAGKKPTCGVERRWWGNGGLQGEGKVYAWDHKDVT